MYTANTSALISGARRDWNKFKTPIGVLKSLLVTETRRKRSLKKYGVWKVPTEFLYVSEFQTRKVIISKIKTPYHFQTREFRRLFSVTLTCLIGLSEWGAWYISGKFKLLFSRANFIKSLINILILIISWYTFFIL